MHDTASTKRSYILKQTCSFKLQVYLSIYDLLLDTKGYLPSQVFPETMRYFTYSYLISFFQI